MVVLHLRTVPSSAARCFASADFASLCVHNSAWSFRIARKLACGSPCLIGLTPRCFAHSARASCAPRGFSRFAASDESSTPLLIGVFVPVCASLARYSGAAERFALSSPFHPFGASTASACFRHRRPSCAPLQFPRKSYGFSGAETARKRFLLWKMGFSRAKITPSPPYTPPGTIGVRKGFGSTIRNSRLAALPLARLLCSLDFRFARFRH